MWDLTRNWSMFRTVWKVLICSLIFSAVTPAATSLSPAPVTDCLFPSRISLSYICPSPVFARARGHRLYVLPASVQCGPRWLTGMASEPHTCTRRLKQIEVSTGAWGWTIKCQQLLIHRGRFSARRWSCRFLQPDHKLYQASRSAQA